MLKLQDISEICCVLKDIQLIQFIDQQKITKKFRYQLKLIFLYKAVGNIL